MAINFPANPSVNDTYTVNSVVYTWDGTKWNASTGFVSYTYADKIQEGDSTAEVIDNGGDAYFAVTNNAVEKFRVNVDGQLSTPYAGNASSPALYVGGDINSGLYSPGADQLAVATNGVGRLFVDASGNVGVGRTPFTSPAGYPLQLRGNIQVFIGMSTATQGDTAVDGFVLGTDNTSAYIIQRENSPLAISTNNQERLRITSAGLVGIGSSAPQNNLHIHESSSGTSLVRFTNDITGQTSADGLLVGLDSTEDGLILHKEAKSLFFGTNSTTAMTIDSSQRVGIGTTSPTFPLTIQHTSGYGITLTNTDTTSTAINGIRFNVSNFTFGGAIYVDSAVAGGSPYDLHIRSGQTLSSICFNNVSGTEHARIDSSGRLLVGTSTDTNNIRLNQKLAIVGTGSGNYPGASITGYSGTNAFAAPFLDFQRSRGTTDGSFAGVISGDTLGYLVFRGSNGTGWTEAATITVQADGEWTTSGDTTDSPGRLVFSTTADGAGVVTERMRISSDGTARIGSTTNNSYFATRGHIIRDSTASIAQQLFTVDADSSVPTFSVFYNSNTVSPNAANATVKIGQMGVTARSINATGSINASGTDYAEYMTKNGQFTIDKGDICGVTGTGFLTNKFIEAVSFVVKSTNPSYVGGDTWGSDFLNDPEGLEQARQAVDRIAFAGQVPVNIIGATAGQYIVPIRSADGGIEGIAKNESDLTLAEYMRAVGKVIAIEDDGRARIIVKVA